MKVPKDSKMVAKVFDAGVGVYFRLVESADLDWIRQLRNEESTYMNLHDPWPVTAADQEGWLSGHSRHDRLYFVACGSPGHALPDAPVGIVRMDQIDVVNRSARVGADVLPDLRRRGFGRAIFQTLKLYCRMGLGLHRIWLEVLSTNEKAIGLYTSEEFVKEGTLRAAVWRDGWVDCYLMGLLL